MLPATSPNTEQNWPRMWQLPSSMAVWQPLKLSKRCYHGLFGTGRYPCQLIFHEGSHLLEVRIWQLQEEQEDLWKEKQDYVWPVFPTLFSWARSQAWINIQVGGCGYGKISKHDAAKHGEQGVPSTWEYQVECQYSYLLSSLTMMCKLSDKGQ